MPAKKLHIQEFLEMSAAHPVLDVRSPGEYAHAHIPGAISFPLFSDQERKVVGTSYKQRSREDAIKIGLDYFGPKMRTMVEQVEQIAQQRKDKTILVHCWRGGMRSGAIAWLLDLYGFDVYLLTGGYKAFRRWVLNSFETAYQFRILGGYTGSGKTEVLKELQQKEQFVIDLEDIAKHKGSSFGALGLDEQPTSEMFENTLAVRLAEGVRSGKDIWLEDESQRIGHINIPGTLWKNMRKAPVYFLEIDFELRLENIVAGYGKYDKDKLVNAIIRIQKRLGPLETKTAINYLLEDNIKECFRILLKYYDKHYAKSLSARERLEELLHKIPCDAVNAKQNARKLLDIKLPA